MLQLMNVLSSSWSCKNRSRAASSLISGKICFNFSDIMVFSICYRWLWDPNVYLLLLYQISLPYNKTIKKLWDHCRSGGVLTSSVRVLKAFWYYSVISYFLLDSFGFRVTPLPVIIACPFLG